MTKYEEALADARDFADKYRDASLPIMIIIGKTTEEPDDSFTIEKVATVTHFTETVQHMLCHFSTEGNEIAPQGTN